MLNSKIAEHHLAQQACIYIRQSTLAQVRFNQESTESKYNLANQARALGWNPEQIRILDGDLAHSAEVATKRDDFKTLVSDAAMGKVGAIFALESSRLARSNKDWHRKGLAQVVGTVCDHQNFGVRLMLRPSECGVARLHYVTGLGVKAERLHISKRRTGLSFLSLAHPIVYQSVQTMITVLTGSRATQP
jgi:Resolvase, N terminal domain